MEGKELISQIKSLNQIKPRKDWVVLVKSQIFNSSDAKKYVLEKNLGKPTWQDLLVNLFRTSFQKSFAYSLALFILVIISVLGLSGTVFNVKVKNASVPAESAPIALAELKSNVEEFKVKSKNLAEAVKYQKKDASLAIKEVKEVAMELTDAIKREPKLAKEVALDINNNKTYLYISGESEEKGDLQLTVNVLYKATFEQLMKDFENATLADSHQESVNKIKESFKNGEYEGRYSDALEDALLIGAAITSEVN